MIPRLIDNRTSNFIHDSLRRCHDIRVETYSYILNIAVIVFFSIISFIILYYCFTTKKTINEERMQYAKDQKYILDKIKEIQIQKKWTEEFLTQLPST